MDTSSLDILSQLPEELQNTCKPKFKDVGVRARYRPKTPVLRWSDVHVTVIRDKFLEIKPTRCTNFSNLFLE